MASTCGSHDMPAAAKREEKEDDKTGGEQEEADLGVNVKVAWEERGTVAARPNSIAELKRVADERAREKVASRFTLSSQCTAYPQPHEWGCVWHCIGCCATLKRGWSQAEALAAEREEAKALRAEALAEKKREEERARLAKQEEIRRAKYEEAREKEEQERRARIEAETRAIEEKRKVCVLFVVAPRAAVCADAKAENDVLS